MKDRDNEKVTKQYNQSISPRARQILAWFKEPAWTEGINPYFSYILATLRDELERPGATDEFVKGQISAFKEILNFPAFIERQVEMSDRPQPKPQGEAGY